jgi:hypothetical protein
VDNRCGPAYRSGPGGAVLGAGRSDIRKSIQEEETTENGGGGQGTYSEQDRGAAEEGEKTWI